ncbi:MAG TPA: SDR family oxidoreductase [Bryobacteraceae bacterium]|nr:SDR family oxidoreductase [Bryobacteraceae bacterium]
MKTYLITGASGIGAETARSLARDGQNSGGVQLFIAARTEEKCKALTAELQSLGAAAEYLAGDLTDVAFAPHLIETAVSRFRRIDGVFNVAGISGRRYGDGPVHQCTEEGWAITLNTNATTQYRVCREAVRVMLAQAPDEGGQRGVILNMASVLGLDPEPKHFDTVAYAASKGAIIALSRTMAASYARAKIRVNVIAPGLVRTPMSARASEDRVIVDFMKNKQPLVEDVIAVEDAAAACVFLLSAAAHAITGHVLAVDAGWQLA